MKHFFELFLKGNCITSILTHQSNMACHKISSNTKSKPADTLIEYMVQNSTTSAHFQTNNILRKSPHRSLAHAVVYSLPRRIQIRQVKLLLTPDTLTLIRHGL